MSREDIILGIDLGTTFSVCAWVDSYGKAQVLPNREGNISTPSCVYIYDEEGCIVGEEALKMAIADPLKVRSYFKRELGDPAAQVTAFGMQLRPQDWSALVLRQIKQDAEEVLGVSISKAVIAVPTHFTALQRTLTLEAGAMAGLEVLSLLNEPTAAAILLSLQSLGQEQRLLVFDLGGGTLDVTLLEIHGLEMITLATGGHPQLGGREWDQRLVDHVAASFTERTGEDLTDDPVAVQDLWERCVQAKIALSSLQKVKVLINFRGHREAFEISRDCFEGLCTEEMASCRAVCQEVLQSAAIPWNQIDAIHLVGGSSRMPMIQEMMRELSGRQEHLRLEPEGAVAMGAALAAVFRHQPEFPSLIEIRESILSQAGFMSQGMGHLIPLDLEEEMALPAWSLREMTTQDLGLLTLKRDGTEGVQVLIPRGTVLPCEVTRRLASPVDNLSALCLIILEGDASTGEFDRAGEVVIRDLPTLARGAPIEVLYRYVEGQQLEVEFHAPQSGERRSGTLFLAAGTQSHRAKDLIVRLDPILLY